MSKRAVITGIGLLTPLGVGREKSWSELVQGKIQQEFGVATLAQANSSVERALKLL